MSTSKVKGKRAQMLVAAGFHIIKKFPGGVWFDAIDPDNEPAAVLCQSESCWHWFSKDSGATASSCMVTRCHRDGLGDAIGTDAQMKTYKRLLRVANVPRELRRYLGVISAMGQTLVD